MTQPCSKTKEIQEIREIAIVNRERFKIIQRELSEILEFGSKHIIFSMARNTKLEPIFFILSVIFTRYISPFIASFFLFATKITMVWSTPMRFNPHMNSNITRLITLPIPGFVFYHIVLNSCNTHLFSYFRTFRNIIYSSFINCVPGSFHRTNMRTKFSFRAIRFKIFSTLLTNFHHNNLIISYIC